MEKRIVQFKGMTNVPDDGINEAGDMSVLLNMRHKGGELVQCQPPSEIDNLSGVKKALFHNNSKCWIVLRDDGSLKAYKNLEDKTPSFVIKEDGAEEFALMGNVVTVVLNSDSEFYLWKDSEFTYLGNFPEVPELTITKSVEEKIIRAGDTYYNYTAFNQSNDKKWSLFSKGFFDQCLQECYASKLYIDNALFIVGLKLFDGSYKFSHLYLVNTDFFNDSPLTFKTISLPTPSNWGGGAASQMEVSIMGYRVSFKMDYDLTLWKDIIVSVDIFTSGSIMNYKVTNEAFYVYDYDNSDTKGMKLTHIGNADVYTQKALPEIRKEIESCSTFYKIESYDIAGNRLDYIDNTSPSKLSAQDRLPYSNVKTFYGKKSTVYNRMSHVASGILLPVFSRDDVYSGEGADPNAKINKKTSIKVGESIYEKEIKIPENPYRFANILSHPIKGVRKQLIEGLYDIDFTENEVLDMSVALGGEKHDFLVKFKYVDVEGSFFEKKEPNSQNYVTYDRDIFLEKINYEPGEYELVQTTNTDSTQFVTINGVTTQGTLSDYGIYFHGETRHGQYFYVSVIKQQSYYEIKPIATQNDVKIDKEVKQEEKDVLRVSALDNPFVFPPTQEYKFDGDIVALASNAEAISSGQFGQYPLYVFTTEGIWAMQVDSTGKTAYSTQTPFSREVCCGDVCPVSGGVVFTTERGLMAISGGNVVELSKPLDGLEELLFNSSGMLAGQIFTRAEYDDHTKFEPVPIREYIKGAKLAYNYLHNEVILSNVNYGYSYVYSLDNQTWGVIDKTFDVTTNSYPELKVFNSDKGVMYEFKDGADANKVVAITRPFTLGSFDYKRLRQAALRTTFEGTLNFYLLGSNDGANFVCITGKEYPSKNGGESMNVTRRDLITAMSRSRQYKYFAIAIAGNMKGRVSLAELLVDAGFANNLLR